MIDYVRLVSRISSYKLCRAMGISPPMPLSIALSVTNRCHSRCKTCNIWRVQREHPERIWDELTAEEWGRILRSMGQGPLWFTITGGEPILRDDLVKIVSYIARYNKPRYLNLATSAFHAKRTADTVQAILEALPGSTMLTVNVSIDEIGRGYDTLRGVPKGFEKVERSMMLLKGLKQRHKNLVIGTNIVLSKYNYTRFEQIYQHISGRLQPDSIVCELGAGREAFFFRDDISIRRERCIELLNSLLDKENQRTKGARVIKRFRNSYYRLMRKQLSHGQVIKCYAGYASAEISPTGELWNCSTRAESMGNLREHDYDFRKVWRSERAQGVRERIRQEGCVCTGANPNYTNILCNMDFLAGFLVPKKF